MFDLIKKFTSALTGVSDNRAQENLIQNLMEALRPFKNLADEIDSIRGDGSPDNWSKACTWPDLLRARDAYNQAMPALSSIPDKAVGNVAWSKVDMPLMWEFEDNAIFEVRSNHLIYTFGTSKMDPFEINMALRIVSEHNASLNR